MTRPPGAPESELGPVALICAPREGKTNAIMEYTRLVGHALRASGVASVTELAYDRVPDLRAYKTVLLQYNPFLYARWGFAPRLVSTLAHARIRAKRPRLGLMVHETYVPISDVRSGIMGSAQRAQLGALHGLSDVVFASIEPWASKLAHWWPRRPVWHLPVGSNMPDCTSRRADHRRTLGADENTLVVVAFGTDHPSRLLDHLVAAVNAIARAQHRVIMLNLGATAPRLEGVTGIEVIRPGPLAAEAVSGLLAAGDLFLAPFVDGVSTRRGSLMAALQHGLPVVGTAGELTDETLRDSAAIELVATDDIEGFARAAASLAVDRDRRLRLGAAAAALYRAEFDWPVIAMRIMTALGAAADRSLITPIAAPRSDDGATYL